MDGRFSQPSNLSPLLKAYETREQGPVRFRPSSWQAALHDVSESPASLLVDPDFTAETSCERFRPKGDRDVTRETVVRACEQMRLDADTEVIKAFVLVMAWGSGTTNSRSLGNTRRALQDVVRASSVLRESAHGLREAKELHDVLGVYQAFSLPGVGEAFFTKWFAFAGRSPGREWQPLILDRRVRATLNLTLGVWLNHLADRRNDSYRYIAYVKALHEWAADRGDAVSAERMEWIFFDRNGEPIKA